MEKGEVYQHYKGGLYEIIEHEATVVDSSEQVVVYKSITSSRVWIRSLKEFIGSTAKDNTIVKRFTLQNWRK